jgi:predicted Fe-S protein YdhL (DUF1289 family)
MAGLETPCIRVCVVHPELRLCVGCGRTLDEIARWIALPNEERSRIMAELPPRLVAMSSASAQQTLPRG